MLCKIGDVEIWRILDWQGPFREPEKLFQGAGPDVAAQIEALAPGSVCTQSGRLILPVQGFLLKTPDHVILVDACIGNHKHNPKSPFWHQRNDGRFMASLGAAGVVPADIDFVMCTHLHTDHVGWNTQLVDGRWVPTFPNAKYLLPAADKAFAEDLPSEMYRESVLPVVEAGQAEFVGPDHALGEVVTLIDTHGHTPGHVSVQIESHGARAVITGDAIHTTAQCWHPDWHFVYDADPVAAAATRRKLLERLSEQGAKVLGTHFQLPSTGRVRSKGNAFEWEG